MFSYLGILILSFLPPLGLSVFNLKHPKQFWIQSFLASFIVAVPFLVWDFWFTQAGYWDFSAEYIVGSHFAGLPIEEILLFLIIPSCCLYLYKSVKKRKASKCLPESLIPWILFSWMAILIGLMFYFQTLYILVLTAYSLIILILSFKSNWWSTYFMTIPFIILGFFIVNGLLTFRIRSISPNPIVWYNDLAIIGIRIGSIPVEDLFYALALTAATTGVYEIISRPKR